MLPTASDGQRDPKYSPQGTWAQAPWLHSPLLRTKDEFNAGL